MEMKTKATTISRNIKKIYEDGESGENPADEESQSGHLEMRGVIREIAHKNSQQQGVGEGNLIIL